MRPILYDFHVNIPFLGPLDDAVMAVRGDARRAGCDGSAPGRGRGKNQPAFVGPAQFLPQRANPRPDITILASFDLCDRETRFDIAAEFDRAMGVPIPTPRLTLTRPHSRGKPFL